MKIAVVLAILAVAVFARSEKEYQSMFTNWMQEHQKSYHHDEFHSRYQTFKLNVDFIDAWNSVPGRHVVKMNKFGDLSNAEFKNLYLGVKVGELNPVYKPANIKAYPAMFDWRHQGAVTAIKDQGQCGSCWSFSTTGSVEGCHFLGTKKLVALSEQNLMDCSSAQGNQACNGGLMTAAMDYIIANGGIDTEASYPYTAEDGTSCNYQTSNRGSTLKSYTNVNSGDENDLQAKVFQGPVSVAIDASQSSFQFYSSGVYSDPNCSSSQLDHGVLAIGWGKTDGTNAQPYWIVKNSWGTSWGQSGFFWMARNDNNMCGIATMATLPSGCQ